MSSFARRSFDTADVPGAMSARGIPEYAFNLQLAREIKQALVDAGFEQTVLLIIATAPWRGLVERNSMRNGNYRHGARTKATIELWRFIKSLR